MSHATCPPERWAFHPVFSSYEVSTHGRVRSIDRTVIDALGRTRRLRSQLLVVFTEDDGRRRVQLCSDGEPHSHRIHQLVLETFVGPRPPEMEGCHWDDDPGHNCVGNLRWATHSANMHDRVRNGNHPLAGHQRCPLDHLLVAPNLRPSHLPHRSCLACSRARGAQQYARRKGRAFDFRSRAAEHYRKIMGEAPALC